jgi:hypothetical protein
MFCALLVAGIYNHRIDRWGVFSDDYRTFYADFQPNYRYLKTRYLLTEATGHTCLIMGSSRVAALDASRLGPHCYNFTQTGGTPVQHLHELELFLDAGLPLQTLYLGVDELAFTWDNRANDKQNDRRGYPANIWQRLRFYAMYLLRLPDADDLEILGGRAPRADRPDWVIHGGLGPVAENRALGESLYKDVEGQRDKFTRLGPSVWHQENNVDQVLTALESIVQLTETQGIELVLFFNPVHYKTWLATDWQALYDFRERLAALHPYYDFSGYNAVNSDDRYWLETSHFSTVAGDAMIDVLSGKAPAIPGFGRLMNPGTTAAAYRRDLADALALYPAKLREQGNIYLPAPVAQALLADMRETDLLGGGTRQGLQASPGVLLKELDGGLQISARRKDPQLVFDMEPLAAGQFAIGFVEFMVPEKGWVDFFTSNTGDGFQRDSRITFRSHKGLNTLYFPLLPDRDIRRIRYDPGRGAGQYELRALKLYSAQ